MAERVCPKCDRRIPDGTATSTSILCPWCGWQGAPLFADAPPGQAASWPASEAPDQPQPETLQPPIEEVRFSFREALVRGFWSGLYLTLGTAALITGMFMAIGVFFFLSGAVPPARLPAFPSVVLLFFLFMWCFVSAAGFPFFILQAIRSRRRVIRVADGRLVVEIGRSKHEIDLAQCSWAIYDLPSDKYGMYFDRKPLIVVGFWKTWFACGFSEEKRAEWKQFLRAAGVRQSPPVRWKKVLPAVLFGGFVGGVLGAFAGSIAAGFGAPPIEVSGIGFLGFLDGAIAVLFYLSLVHQWYGRTGRGGFVAFTTVCFGGFGLLFAIPGGLWSAVIIPPCNAILGALAGWHVFSLATRNEGRSQPPNRD